MKTRFMSAWIAGVLLTCAAPARAQSLGQFTGAQTLPLNGRAFGAYVHAGAHVVGFVSQLRLSFYPGVDFGFQGGLDRLDFSGADRTLVRLGTDFKVASMKAGGDFPVDLSLGGALGVDAGDNMSVLTLGPTVIASRTFPAGKDGNVTPYAALGIGYSSVDVPGKDDTGLQLPLRIGAEFLIAPEFHLVIELQQRIGTSYGDRGALLIGANLPF